MKEKLNSLNPGDLQALSKCFDTLTFPNDFDLVYEEQVPSAGIALVEGEIQLIKGSRIKEVVKPGHIFGITNLINEQPFEYGCRVKANSKIILLGKSEILTCLKDKRSKLSQLLGQLK